MTHISRAVFNSCSKYKFKNQRWWLAAILKTVKCNNSATF